MEKVRYMISDAAQIIAVETHVLRYWEDELSLQIPRNEVGHRYYTKENLEEFRRIKELKDKGYRLRAIRLILHNEAGSGTRKEFKDCERAHVTQPHETDLALGTSRGAYGGIPVPVELDQTEKLAQFTEMMTEIVGRALEANNEKLGKSISEDVGEHLIKEMNYLMKEREEADEERFRKLDEAIRGSLGKKEQFKFGWGKKNKRL
jgi:DNA-binding transcriptional MerR regulator